MYDKLTEIYEVVVQENKVNENRILNLQSKIEKIEEEHRTELKVYMAKIRSSHYEHQLALQDLQEKGEQKMLEEETYHRQQLEDFTSEKNEKVKKFNTLDSKNQSEIDKNIDDVNAANEIDFLNWEGSLKKAQKDWDSRLKNIKEDLQLRLKIEIHEIEERMNAHINGLLRQHEQDYNDIKDYFRDITRDNIQLIKNQKVEISKLKDNIAKSKIEYNTLQHEMEKDEFDNSEIITEEEVNNKYNELEQIRKNHKTAKVLYKNLEKKSEDLSNDLEEIISDIDDKMKLKDDYLSDFEFNVKKVKFNEEKYNETLVQKIQALNDQKEEKEVYIQEIVEKKEIDPRLVEELSRKIEETLDAKNKLLKNLK